MKLKKAAKRRKRPVRAPLSGDDANYMYIADTASRG